MSWVQRAGHLAALIQHSKNMRLGPRICQSCSSRVSRPLPGISMAMVRELKGRASLLARDEQVRGWRAIQDRCGCVAEDRRGARPAVCGQYDHNLAALG